MAKTGSIGFAQGTQDIANNRTYLEVRGYITTSGDSWRGDQRSGSVSISQNGTTIYSGSFTHGAPKNSTTELFAVGIWINHDSVGNSGTITASYDYDSGWCYGSGSTILTSIPRQANITSAPNFTDEDNPTITYSNPAGNAVGSLQACISLTGSEADIAYRDISKTGSSYTFNLTDTERNVLRNATLSGSNSRTVIFHVKTVIGANTFYSTAERTFTVINNKPTLSPSAKDINPITLAITNDESMFIRYYSNAQVSIGATAKKGASIVSQKVICGSQNVSGGSGVINAVDSGTFVFSATDNRGNTVSSTINAPFIEYIKLTCDLLANSPDTNGNLDFSVSGNYYNNSFGTTDNVLSLKYCYSENGGDFSSWQTLSATISETNKYTASSTISGLDYRSSYIIKVIAKDLLTEVISESKALKTVPVFDWGENDFNFNVPMLANAGLKQPILAESTDINTVLTPNTYTGLEASTAGYVNCPITEGRFFLEVLGTNLDESEDKALTQRLTCCVKEKTLVYERHYYAGAWGAWVSNETCLYTEIDGASYYKFPDGTLICRVWPYVSNYACTSAWGAGLYDGPAISLGNWPHEFVNTPTVTATFYSTEGGFAMIEGLSGVTKISAGATYLCRGTANTVTGYVFVIGVGRWK